MVQHPIEPIYNKDSEILILGSFPSVKSREEGFFYAHPQNRFWKVLAGVYEDEVPKSVEDKRDFLMKHHVAVWDVIHSCDIVGSSDSSIRNVVVNDLNRILQTASIRRICVNGKKAEQLYMRYIYPQIRIKPMVLPSTSPANAVKNIESLVQAWSCIREK